MYFPHELQNTLIDDYRIGVVLNKGSTRQRKAGMYFIED